MSNLKKLNQALETFGLLPLKEEYLMNHPLGTCLSNIEVEEHIFDEIVSASSEVLELKKKLVWENVKETHFTMNHFVVFKIFSDVATMQFTDIEIEERKQNKDFTLKTSDFNLMTVTRTVYDDGDSLIPIDLSKAVMVISELFGVDPGEANARIQTLLTDELDKRFSNINNIKEATKAINNEMESIIQSLVNKYNELYCSPSIVNIKDSKVVH